jgi:hypothetical protein
VPVLPGRVERDGSSTVGRSKVSGAHDSKKSNEGRTSDGVLNCSVQNFQPQALSDEFEDEAGTEELESDGSIWRVSGGWQKNAELRDSPHAEFDGVWRWW